MIVTILGKRWSLEFVPRRELGKQEGRYNLGFCDAPEIPNKRICIASGLSGVDRLDTIIHEVIHAGNFKLSEEFVEQFSTDLARILDKLGYRCEGRHGKE